MNNKTVRNIFIITVLILLLYQFSKYPIDCDCGDHYLGTYPHGKIEDDARLRTYYYNQSIVMLNVIILSAAIYVLSHVERKPDEKEIIVWCLYGITLILIFIFL